MIDPVALTRDLIRCRSVTPADDGAIDTVARALEGLGFACHRLSFGGTDDEPEIRNLYAKFGDGGRTFCFAGHTDVVPAGDPKDWRCDPFAAEIVDGVLYGRGAVDMKSAVAAFVAGIDRFLDRAGRDFGGSISLIVTGDEEGRAVNGTAKVLDWMDRRGERLDVCVVGEPTNPAALGDAFKIGRRGSMTGILTVHGVQGHTAYPHLADNPLNRMAQMLAALTAKPLDQGSDRFDPTNLEITTIDVGNPASNVIPPTGRAVFNIRFNDRHTSDSLKAWTRETLDAVGGRYDLSFQVSGESFLTEPGPFTDLVADAVERVTGRRPEASTSGGTSDARFIRRHCPVVEFGAINKTIHKVDEHIAVADIDKLADIYAAMLHAYFDI